MATDKQIEKQEKHVEDPIEVSVRQKLIALYTLQINDSQIDRIRIVRGELPLEGARQKMKLQAWKPGLRNTRTKRRSSTKPFQKST